MRRQVCDAIDNNRRLRRCLTTRKACSNCAMIVHDPCFQLWVSWACWYGSATDNSIAIGFFPVPLDRPWPLDWWYVGSLLLLVIS